MLMGITYSSQQSSRDGLLAKAWCPTHSSSTARARAGAGKRKWFARAHCSQASIPGDSAESTPPPAASQALASANGVVLAGVLVTSLPEARGSAPARKSCFARDAGMQLMWWSGVHQPRLSMSHARTCACLAAHCLECGQ